MNCPNSNASDAPLPRTEGADPTPTSPGTSSDVPSLLLSSDDAEFNRVCIDLRRQFDPDDLLGILIADQLVLAARRLRKAARLEPDDEIPDAAWCRFQSLAERGFRASLTALQRHQSPLTATKTARKTDEPDTEGPSPKPAPAAPARVESPEQIAEARLNWRDRIALVRSVSETWPVIVRTGREVEDVAAWLTDGRTEEELLAFFPELSRLDIAACRGCDAEGLCGPFDPDSPDPPGLPVLDELPEAPSSG